MTKTRAGFGAAIARDCAAAEHRRAAAKVSAQVAPKPKPQGGPPKADTGPARREAGAGDKMRGEGDR